MDYYTRNLVQLGGPNTVVQIDETNIILRKYNVGQVVREDWMVGRIHDGTEQAFFEIVFYRNASNLEAIHRHVLLETIIRTSMRAEYNNLVKHTQPTERSGVT